LAQCLPASVYVVGVALLGLVALTGAVLPRLRFLTAAAVGVTLWVAGFDVIYSLQDEAKAAQEAGVDLSDRLQRYAAERLPALLLERKQQAWTADEQTLREFYDANPRIGHIEERRHVGQLVTATREEAEALRRRILGGESLFELAAQYSVDPYGREHHGDMGWQQEGRAHPAIEQGIAELQDHQLSEVIETPAGFHLITILERRAGGQMNYLKVRDRVRQLWITEQMARYMSELAKQHQVVWHLVEDADKP
jgi:peptidyl-prolyl cis-trans isomerase C